MRSRTSKRVLDVSLVLLAAPFLLLPMALIALLVWIDVGWPVIFSQQRAGKHGRPFTIFKYRTMTDNRSPTGSHLPDVGRLTRVGRFLRGTSLDELPELVNVLKGEMSLVGPRPLLLHYLPRYTAWQARRHEVPPGVTGWAQVHGRNALTWEEKFALDVWYVDNWSLGVDLRIIGMTIVGLLSRRGIAAPGHATMPEFEGTNGNER